MHFVIWYKLESEITLDQSLNCFANTVPIKFEELRNSPYLTSSFRFLSDFASSPFYVFPAPLYDHLDTTILGNDGDVAPHSSDGNVPCPRDTVLHILFTTHIT